LRSYGSTKLKATCVAEISASGAALRAFEVPRSGSTWRSDTLQFAALTRVFRGASTTQIN
jgi:hypothetical protein